MRFPKLLSAILTVSIALPLSLTGCATPAPAPEETGPFNVVLSSETEFLKPIIEKVIRDKGLEPVVTVGSGTIELADSLTRMRDTAPDAVAVMGGSWLPDAIGESVVNPAETVAWSPVVIGFKPGTASSPAIPITELLTIVTKNPKAVLAARGESSDASVLFWIGALSAKQGSKTIQEGEVRKPELDATFGSLIKSTVQIDETAGPLVSQAQSSLDKLKGVITYEAAIQQMNSQLDAAKKPKLQSTRLKGGTLCGTITLSFVGKSPKKQEVFQSVLSALKEASNQKVIQEKGWLTTAPGDVLETPLRGTLWAAKRRFEQAVPKLAAQTSVRP